MYLLCGWVPLGSKISAHTEVRAYFIFRHIHTSNLNPITRNWFRSSSSGNGGHFDDDLTEGDADSFHPLSQTRIGSIRLLINIRGHSRLLVGMIVAEKASRKDM